MKSIDEIIKEFEKLINPTNYVNVANLIYESLPDILEGFVEFYGEESREEIIEKFSRFKLDVTISDFDMIFKYLLLDQLNDYMKNRFPSEYNCSIDEFIRDGSKLKGKSQEYINTCNEIITKIASFIKFKDKHGELRVKLEQKYNEEGKGKINTFIRNILMDELNYTKEMVTLTDYSRLPDDGPTVRSIFSPFEDGGLFYNIRGGSDLIEIIRNFRNLGINIPKLNCESKSWYDWDTMEFEAAKKEFYDFISDPNVSKFIPTKEIAEKIISKNYDLYTESRQKCDMELIKQLYGLKLNDVSNFLGIDYNPMVHITCGGVCAPSLINDNNDLKIGGLLSINASFALLFGLEIIGHIIIHEANHGLESTCIFHDSTYELKTGWDFCKSRDNITHKTIKVSLNRKMELFNECINDLITIDILNIIKKKKNNVIFNDGFCSLYTNGFFAVEEFYQLYKPEIIESRKNHNMDALYQKIGYENFEALAELVGKVSEQLYAGKFNYDRVRKDLDNGVMNSESEFLASAINERDRILNNMKEYSQVSHKSRGIVTMGNIIMLLIITFIFSYIIWLILK